MSVKNPFAPAGAAARTKICCISSEEEAARAVRAGAAALGLVGRMPSGPGVIDDASIRRIAAGVPPGTATFLLTAETKPDAIVAHRARTLTTAIQVVHVEDAACVERALAAASFVDAILLDSGSTKKAVKELGGTGRAHDWSLSRRIVEAVAVPVFLAGGPNPENAAAAFARVRPYGLDACTGVRTGGRLDDDKLARFVAAARRDAKN